MIYESDEKNKCAYLFIFCYNIGDFGYIQHKSYITQNTKYNHHNCDTYSFYPTFYEIARTPT